MREPATINDEAIRDFVDLNDFKTEGLYPVDEEKIPKIEPCDHIFDYNILYYLDKLTGLIVK